MRLPRFKKRTVRSSVISMKLDNYYNFQDTRDVTHYKTRLWEGLHSTGSTRLPTATVTLNVPSGQTVSVES